MNRAETDTLDPPFRRFLAWKALLVLAVTAQLTSSLRLWTPQSEFPQIPMVSGFIWPDTVAWGLLVTLFVALGLILINVRNERLVAWPDLLFVCTAVALLLEDQHRMQPWLIHELWLFGILLLGGTRHLMRLTVALTASLYIYSALSKCNVMFLEQHGQIVLSGLFQSLNLDLTRVPETARRVLMAGFPLGEAAIGVGLLFSRTRRGSAILAMLMHALLMLTFSSRGLNHEWSVLLWNLFFLLQALVLWGLPASLFRRHQPWTDSELTDCDSKTSPRHLVATGLLVTIWCFPILRFTGHLDQWLGWSLYSPRATVVRVMLGVSPELISPDFPPHTRTGFQWIQGDSAPIAFLPDRWSLAELHVPLNPEARLEFAVAWSLCERFDCWDDVVIVLEHRDLMAPAERQSRQFSGREEFRTLAERYRLPTQSNRRFLAGSKSQP